MAKPPIEWRPRPRIKQCPASEGSNATPAPQSNSTKTKKARGATQGVQSTASPTNANTVPAITSEAVKPRKSAKRSNPSKAKKAKTKGSAKKKVGRPKVGKGFDRREYQRVLMKKRYDADKVHADKANLSVRAWRLAQKAKA